MPLVDEHGGGGAAEDRAWSGSDAAVIAVVLADQSSASGAAGLGKVRNLLASGRLSEARQVAR